MSGEERGGRIAIVQAVVLFVGVGLVFREELAQIVRVAARSPDACHLFAAPVLIGLLVMLRRRWIAAGFTGGSVWGVGLVILALVIYVVAAWMNYAYPQWASIVPAAAGVILAVGGRRVLWRCLPLVVLLGVAVPLGMRIYARLIIGPETYTLQAVAILLDCLPGMRVELMGPDLYFAGDMGTGAVALGESNRGAMLLLSSVVLGLFATFARVRPLRQVVVMVILLGPAVLFCNLLRVLLWALTTMLFGSTPTSHVPRMVSTVVSLVAGYGLFLLLLATVRVIVGGEAPAVPVRRWSSGVRVGPSRVRFSLSPSFVLALVVLAAAAMGLHPAVGVMLDCVRKEPAALRLVLDAFDDTRLASFRPAGPGHGYELREGDMETEEVLHQVYEVRATSDLDATHPYVMLFVTYYNDPRSSIPHTPEVCYRQAGAVVSSITTTRVGEATSPGGLEPFEAKLVDIDNAGVRIALVYAFCQNGRMYHDREQVRVAMHFPGERRMYFSKIEAVSICPPETSFQGAVSRCTRMLRESVPVLLEDHFPRPEDLTVRE